MKFNIQDVIDTRESDIKGVILESLALAYRDDEDLVPPDDFYSEDGSLEIEMYLVSNGKIKLKAEEFINWLVENFKEQNEKIDKLERRISNFKSKIDDMFEI